MIYDDEFEEIDGIEIEDDDENRNRNDILYYLVDEDDNEIGFGYLLEGEVYEHYYDNSNYCQYDEDKGYDEDRDPWEMYTYCEESEYW